MNTITNPSKIGTWHGWTEPAEQYDPLEDAAECPRCGELPEWERDGKWSSRHRLNCCGINNSTRGAYQGQEVKTVIAWNEAVAYEKEVILWDQEEAKTEARHEVEDKWVDENLPEVA